MYTENRAALIMKLCFILELEKDEGNIHLSQERYIHMYGNIAHVYCSSTSIRRKFIFVFSGNVCLIVYLTVDFWIDSYR